MLTGVVAVLLSVQAPPVAPPPKADSAAATSTSCRTPIPTEPGEVVVCAERPSGYRIDPDVLEAERAKKNPRGLKPPERHVDWSCETVGPMGCRGAVAIDLLSAGAAIAKMADKISKGASVGSLFVTTPTPSEYELYLEAKRRREAREEAAFEAAAVKAAKTEKPVPAK
jgi:hypothetical protein